MKKKQLDNPAFEIAVTPTNERIFTNKQMTPTFAIRVRKIMQLMNLTADNISPEFSYTLLDIVKPSCNIKSPKIELELCKTKKQKTPDVVYKQKFLQMMVEKYGDCPQIYTDESKSDSGVSVAACTEQMKRSITLQKTASILTAEMQAIQLAVDIIKQSNSRNSIILTDSHSIIRSLQDKYARNPMSRKLQR